MKRFFVNDIQVRDGRIAVRGAEANHICRVMRMGPGERFILMDGNGRRYRARIERSDPREVVATLEETLPTPEPSPLTVDLCQALLKSGAMDYLVQKTSELGVDIIRPFSSARTVVRLSGERTERRLRHWREIAKNAAKQSDRISPARIEPPIPFSELVSRWEAEEAFKVIFWEAEGAGDLKGLMEASDPVARFVGMVGPEGGFSREEVDMARNAGFQPASLGRRILRAETAAVAMTTIAQYEWGDLSLKKDLDI